MTDPNKTEIAVILDRSGSMRSIQADMVGGFAEFVETQRAVPGQCVLSLYQFDAEYDVVYEARPLADVGALTLVPRGSTALLDAIGRTVLLLGARLARLPEAERPGVVVVLVITDGLENASKEFSREAIRALIKQQESTYNWRFVYLGADAKSFDEAQGMGFAPQSSAQYEPNSVGTRAAYGAVSNAVHQYRSAVAAGDANARVHLEAAEGLTTPDEPSKAEP